jgi:hypothetical protein
LMLPLQVPQYGDTPSGSLRKSGILEVSGHFLVASMNICNYHRSRVENRSQQEATGISKRLNCYA